MILSHNTFIPPKILLVGLPVLHRTPKLIISVETFSYLPLGRGINAGNTITSFRFLKMHCHHFELVKMIDQVFDKLLVTCVSSNLPMILGLLPVRRGSSVDESRHQRLHEFERELCDAIGLNVFLNHPRKFDDLLSRLFLLVLDLPSEFERLMLLTENKVFELI